MDDRNYAEIIFMVKGAHGIDLNDTNLSNKSLQRVDLSDVTIMRANFNTSNLQLASMPNSQLIECIFNYADFSGAKLTNTIFIKADLVGTILSNASVDESTFEECIITGISAYGLFASYCIFKNCNFTDTTFPSVHLINSEFTGCEYLRGSFEGSDLFELIIKDSEFTNTRFAHCGFDNARINTSKFVTCIFNNCTFVNVIFDESTFQRCIFNSCDFTDAIFINSALPESQFEDCIFLRTRFINTNTASAQILPAVGPVVAFDVYFADIYNSRANDLATIAEIQRATADGFITNDAAQSRIQTLNISSTLQCDNDTDFFSSEPWSATFRPDIRIRYLAATATERDNVLCITASDLRQWIALDGNEFRAWYPNIMRQASGRGVDPDGRGGLPSNVEVFWRMPIYNQLVVNPPVDILRIINSAISMNTEIVAYPLMTEKTYGTPIQPYFVQSAVHGQPSHARTVYILTLGDPLPAISNYVGYMYDIRGLQVPEEITMESYYAQAGAIKNIVPVADRPYPQPQELQVPINTLLVHVNYETGMIDLDGAEGLINSTIVIESPNNIDQAAVQPHNIVLLITPDGIQEVLRVPEGVLVQFSNDSLDEA